MFHIKRFSKQPTYNYPNIKASIMRYLFQPISLSENSSKLQKSFRKTLRIFKTFAKASLIKCFKNPYQGPSLTTDFYIKINVYAISLNYILLAKKYTIVFFYNKHFEFLKKARGGRAWLKKFRKLFIKLYLEFGSVKCSVLREKLKHGFMIRKKE